MKYKEDILLKVLERSDDTPVWDFELIVRGGDGQFVSGPLALVISLEEGNHLAWEIKRALTRYEATRDPFFVQCDSDGEHWEIKFGRAPSLHVCTYHSKAEAYASCEGLNEKWRWRVAQITGS